MLFKVLMVLVGIVVIIGATIGIGLASGALGAPKLESLVLSWGEIREESTGIDADIVVDNPSVIGINPPIQARLSVYFHDVEAAVIEVPEVGLSSGITTLHAAGAFSHSSLAEWWPAFVDRGEVLDLRAEPEVNARLFWLSVGTSLPGMEQEIDMPLLDGVGRDQPVVMGFDVPSASDLLSDPRATFRAGPPDPRFPVLTMESWELHWGEATSESTQVLGAMYLRNETPAPLVVQGIRLSVDMNEIEVIPEAEIVPEDPVIPPGETARMNLDATIDNDLLVEWWRSHLHHEENTTMEVRIGMTVVLPGEGALGLGRDLELPLVAVPDFRCDLQTDIMGAANYEIARALNNAPGARPDAYSYGCTSGSAPRIE